MEIKSCREYLLHETFWFGLYFFIADFKIIVCDFIVPTDEVSALVLDLGSDIVKGGYAGEDTPKVAMPTVSFLRQYEPN